MITTFHSCHRYEYFKPNLNIKTQNQNIFDSVALQILTFSYLKLLCTLLKQTFLTNFAMHDFASTDFLVCLKFVKFSIP